MDHELLIAFRDSLIEEPDDMPDALEPLNDEVFFKEFMIEAFNLAVAKMKDIENSVTWDKDLTGEIPDGPEIWSHLESIADKRIEEGATDMSLKMTTWKAMLNALTRKNNSNMQLKDFQHHPIGAVCKIVGTYDKEWADVLVRITGVHFLEEGIIDYTIHAVGTNISDTDGFSHGELEVVDKLNNTDNTVWPYRQLDSFTKGEIETLIDMAKLLVIDHNQGNADMAKNWLELIVVSFNPYFTLSSENESS